MIFTNDGKKRELLYLAAAVPRPSCPQPIADARLRGAAAYSACPIVALPCLAPLAFLESEPSKILLRAAAAALSGGLSVTGISTRQGIAFADLGPRERWLEARAAFFGLSLDSFFSSGPGICLGPAAQAAPARSFAYARSMSLSVDLFMLRSPEGRWEGGMGWEMLASIRCGKAAASQSQDRVI